MYRAMGIVRFVDLAPGMTLDADVVGADGRLLLAAGVSLTAHHLRILGKWGIDEAHVRGVTREDLLGEAQARLTAADIEAVDARMAALFRRVDAGHPAVHELMELTRRRMIGEVLEDRADAS
jgi:hypothetical protein